MNAELWLHNGLVFDGTGAPARIADILISADRIAAVVEPSADNLQKPGSHLDLEGRTVLPGLIDAHAHIGILNLQNQAVIAPAVQAAMIFRILSAALDQGFTTLRDLGGIDKGIVDALEAGFVEGPRVLPSGQIISQTAGHGDARSRYGYEEGNPSTGVDTLTLPMRIADGVDEVRRAARDQYRRGATQLKIFASGGQLSEGDPIECPQYSVEEIRAIVQVAEDRDSYVTAHAHTVRGIRRAIEGGVRCIEHASVLDEDTIQLMKAEGVFAVPTLTVSEQLRVNADAMGVKQEWLVSNDELSARAAESIKRMDAAGIPMGSGADLIGEHQDARGWEVSLKAEILGVEKAIVSATLTNARILGIDDETGSIETGKLAEIAVFDGDPLRNHRVFREQLPVLVLQRGEIVRDRRSEK